MTVPLIGWTPKARREDHPYDCGFKVSKYGAQDSTDYWDPDCDNGWHNGVQLTGNNPTDTSVAITSSFVTAWINHLKGNYGTAANGGVMFYNLDNEPMLWNSTHYDVHPNPVTYDEMRDKTYAQRHHLAEHAYQQTRMMLRSQKTGLSAKLAKHGISLNHKVLNDPKRFLTAPVPPITELGRAIEKLQDVMSDLGQAISSATYQRSVSW